MDFTQTELVAASNLQKLLMKQEYNLDAKGVVETYHAFNFLDRLVDHIEAEVKKREFSEAVSNGTMKKTKKKVAKK